MAKTWSRPVVGILVTPEAVARLPEEPPLGNINLHMSAAEQVGVAAYVFTLADVSTERREIHGWKRENGIWLRAPVPWPDIYYDLAYHVTAGNESRTLYDLMVTSMPINWARSLGKWECHEILALYEDTKPLLPETVCSQDPHELCRMVEKHGAVFVKPEMGSGGSGISRVWSTGRDRYGWQGSRSSDQLTDLTLEQVVAQLRATAGWMPWVIQAEIQLYETEGRKVDLRVGMQRDGAGAWTFSMGGTRVAAPGSIVTNWVRGGDWTPYPDGLQVFAVTDNERAQLWATITKTACIVVDRLEEQIGPMGEVGLDLGFDKDWRLWFIEANPMPNKTPVAPKNGLVHPKYARVFEYAKYLYQQNRSPETP